VSNYLETIYFKDEFAEEAFPQQLCDHLIKKCGLEIAFPPDHILKLLDIGSGKGNHLIGFARRGFSVCGVDKREECCESVPEIPVHKVDIERARLPFKSDKFDVVFSKSVIEHVANADNFLKETFRVLRPGGMAIILTPDWNTQHTMFWDDYTHVKAWTRKSLQNAMKIHQFFEVECTLFRQLPILWEHPWLKPICDLVSLLPHSCKWKDKNEEQHRPFIRFSKEKMILATGVK